MHTITVSITGVIMRKFRTSMEPLRDLKIIEYVEYLSRISSEYFTGITGAFVMTDKGSVYSTHACSITCHDWSEIWKLYCVVKFVSVIDVRDY